MAKKPSQEPRLKPVLKRYISRIGELGKEIKVPKVEYGYIFHYPKGTITQKRQKKFLGRSFQAFKPKSENTIVINHKTEISPEHAKSLASNPKLKAEVYSDIIKVFLIKNVEYVVKRQENAFFLSVQIFLENEGKISMNQFYKAVRNLFSADLYSVIIIQEKCSGKVKGKDVDSPYHI